MSRREFITLPAERGGVAGRRNGQPSERMRRVGVLMSTAAIIRIPTAPGRVGPGTAAGGLDGRTQPAA